MEETYGIISIIPILVIIVSALITKRTMESILFGAIVGFIILAGGNPLDTFEGFLDALYVVMTDEDCVWVFLVVVLFGSLIALMEQAGGVFGFSRLTEKLIKGRKSSLIGTWVLGIIVYVDDYLNCLAVGSAMRSITDRNKVSREMLAYIINSTGVTVCAIVPFSTWGAFMGGLMEKNNVGGEGVSAFSAYTSTIPFVVYGWFAIIVVPLFCLKIIPLFGPMKRAEERALSTGEVFSAESKQKLTDDAFQEPPVPQEKRRALNFIVPILIVAAITIWMDEILYGIFAAIIACMIMYLPQRLMNLYQYFSAVVKGIVEMTPVVIIIILAYALQEANDGLGLTDFVIDGALKAVNPAFLPMTIFVVVGLLSFASGTFWGLAMIAFPIVAPLAEALGANPFLCAGAIISAVCFGGHICIYSDTVILTAASTQSSNVDYFKTSFPLVAVPAVLSVIGFLILGFVMA